MSAGDQVSIAAVRDVLRDHEEIAVIVRLAEHARAERVFNSACVCGWRPPEKRKTSAESHEDWIAHVVGILGVDA